MRGTAGIVPGVVCGASSTELSESVEGLSDCWRASLCILTPRTSLFCVVLGVLRVIGSSSEESSLSSLGKVRSSFRPLPRDVRLSTPSTSFLRADLLPNLLVVLGVDTLLEMRLLPTPRTSSACADLVVIVLGR